MFETWRISLRGKVQGVGFRPFVWKMAVERNLRGCVSNGMEGLEVLICTTKPEAVEFRDFLLKNAPTGSYITSHCLDAVAPQFFDTFSIQESTSHSSPLLLMSADVALCANCLADLQNITNRRYAYAFTTCTYCGPRYSIIAQLPYDREHTTMLHFQMCSECAEEFQHPEDRRFFAQTNSCPSCGIKMQLLGANGTEISTDANEIFEKTVTAWCAGNIVAIKGIGGYLLTCDATNANAIQLLRLRKNRPTKPFALMYPDLDTLGSDVRRSNKQFEALQSPVAPIVLFSLKNRTKSGIAHTAIAPGLDKIGVMLPHTPLFAILLEKFGKPIVATSGNMSHSPIVFREQERPQLEGIADFFLSHNREIVVPQDDSVLAFAGRTTPIVLRRARGLAPTLLIPDLKISPTPLIALGAEMKATFALTYNSNLFISQYLGDLSDFDTQQRYSWLLRRTLNQFSVQPSAVLGDLHPNYFTTAFGRDLAAELHIPFVQIQHHEAHFTAILAEKKLLETKKPILGVIWDGTGYGKDGQIWGGEFFSYQADKGMRRIGHLPYFPFLLGDKMAREPRIAALAFCQQFAPNEIGILSKKFNATEWQWYIKMIAKEQPTLTSSVGRLFDALAALLGLSDKVSYEGEAALLLETVARQYLRNNTASKESYFSRINNNQAPFSPDWFNLLIEATKEQRLLGEVAALFHLSLVEMVAAVAETGEFESIAFSGGVFQNVLLVELLQKYLVPRKWKLYFHQALSPNDENMAFGQLFYHTTLKDN